MIDAAYIKPGAVVCDVGIHVDANGKLCGDVNAAQAAEAALLTPVPGGGQCDQLVADRTRRYAQRSACKGERNKMEREQLHAALLEEISGCQRCRLCEGRTHVVPGEGNLWARLMIIGEGPGANEDAQGRPFVGRAGQLLDEMIDCIGLQREEVYICNVVMPPPQNRAPKDDEAQACMPYLERQIELVQPGSDFAHGRYRAQPVCEPRSAHHAARVASG